MPTTTNGTTIRLPEETTTCLHASIPQHQQRATRRASVRLRTAAVIGASLAMAGCASGGGGDGATDITFHMSKPEAIPYFRDLIKEYNASQDDVNVVLDTASNLQAGFLRGNPPDIGLLNYNMEMARFMERGALSDLSDMPEADRILPEVQELVDQCGVSRAHERAAVLGHGRSGDLQQGDLRAERPRGAHHGGRARDCVRDAHGGGRHAVLRDLQGPVDGRAGLVRLHRGRHGRRRGLLRGAGRGGHRRGPDSEVSFQKDQEPVDAQEAALDSTNPDAASRGYGDGNIAMAKGEAAMYLQGPWAFGEIAKAAPDLELGMFPLPVTDDPDDLKARINMDLAAWIPEASDHQEAARAFLELPLPAGRHGRVQRVAARLRPTKDAPPVTDRAHRRACRSTSTRARSTRGRRSSCRGRSRS